MTSSIIFAILSGWLVVSLNHVSVCFLRFHQWLFMAGVSPFGSTDIPRL